MKSSLIKATLFSLGLSLSGTAQAAAIFTVDGTSNPWNWTKGGLNDAFQFGAQDGTGPTIASFAAAGITAGGSWAVVYKSGVTSAFGGAPPSVNNNGYVGSIFKDDDPGSSGNYFPGHYMPTEWNSDPGAGLFLNALVGAFTDDNGQIIGNPFSVGTVFFDGANYSFLIGVGGNPTPAGATRIQLGLNDDIFSDNSGSLDVCVGENFDACANATAAVPEPSSWALMLAGFGLAGAIMRRREKVRVRFA